MCFIEVWRNAEPLRGALASLNLDFGDCARFKALAALRRRPSAAKSTMTPSR